MSETAISVTDVARDFLGALRRLESNQESAVIIRNGQPVAKLVPCSKPITCGEDLADWWAQRERLPSDEAEEFARDLEHARTNLPPLQTAWD